MKRLMLSVLLLVSSLASAQIPVHAPDLTWKASNGTNIDIDTVDVGSIWIFGQSAKVMTDSGVMTLAPLASPTFTGTVAGITKAMVGLGSVDNTSDASKPISTAVQTALDAKAASSHVHVDGDIPNTITIDQATLALTGDSATAFFSTGTLEDARLSANVSLLGSTIGGAELGNPAVGTKGGVEALTCTGNDKISAIGTTGVPVCSADTGASVSQQIMLCPPGTLAANVCHTWTNLPAGVTEAGTNATRTFVDLAQFTQFRIVAWMNAAAVAGDIQISCDTDSTFGSPTVLGTLDNPAANGSVGNWTNKPGSGECVTVGGVWMRVSMLNGNGTEDPAARRIYIEVK